MNIEAFARVPLGVFPTPIEPLAHMGADLDIALSVKHDDYTGFGGGGNKIRKLEFLLAEAIAQKANVLITAGGLQSNHARMTAAAARKFGMKPVLALRGHKPNAIQGNLLLDHLLDAEIDYFDPGLSPAAVAERMQSHADKAAAAGGKGYVIPVGGSNALGTVGYVACVKEMAEQYRQSRTPAPEFIVLPAGSGGTLAGVHIGCSLYWPDTKIIGIAISVSNVPFGERLAATTNACAELLGLERRWTAEDIWIEHGHVGDGYAIPSQEGNAAIKYAATMEGMLLDPVYTGKSLAGLIACARSDLIPKGSSVLFLHTGGTPALYSFASSLTGPAIAA